MTREEAYNRIDAIIAKYKIDDEYVTITNFKDYDALRLARKLLEQEPCDKCVYSTKDGYCQYDDIIETIPPFEPCENCISRDEAVYIAKHECNHLKIASALERLPSAKPKQKTGEG